jgi:uncharacterized membrane protein
MEFIEHLETQLAVFVAFLQLGLEAIAAGCVLTGLVKTGQLALVLFYRHTQPNRHYGRHFTLALLRLRFGVWLAIALEFQLGADVVATTVAPTFEALGKLGAIAAIRTFLNHFLNQELAEELKVQRRVEQETAKVTHEKS